ncbi:MAG: hypothetical protein ACREHV_05920 [Rhizomicrobium sp.]
MNDRSAAEIEVVQALTCPLDMATLFRVEPPASFEPLERLWHEIVERHAVDQEAAYVGEFVSVRIRQTSDESLRQMQINVRTWHGTARQEFLVRTRRYSELRYTTRQEYSKHLPPPGQLQTAACIEETSRAVGRSLFYQDVPPDVMLSAFLHGIFFHFEYDAIERRTNDDALWDKLLNADHCRVAFRGCNEIGASDGLPTRFLVFDFDALTPILHGYPISELEADAVQGRSSVITVDDLRDWGRCKSGR